MSQQAMLSSLTRLDVPIADLKIALATLLWDAGPVITLTRQNIAAVLERFVNGDIEAAIVEERANLVEYREDIGFETGYEEVVADAIYILANPKLAGQLAAITPVFLSSIRP